MATLHQGEDVARTVAAGGLVPVRPVLHRRVSRGLRDDPLLRSALDPGQWRRDAGWRGLGRAAARTYRLGRAALQSRPADREIFAYSAWLMAILTIVLAGKGVSALPEAGIIETAPLGGGLRRPLLGIFPPFPSSSE